MLSIGLMSGTSMDGIDAALIETDGLSTINELAHTALTYDNSFRELMKAAEFAVREAKGNVPLAKKNYQQALHHYLMTELGIASDSLAEKLAELSQYFHHDAKTLVTYDEIIQRSTELHIEVVQQLLQASGYPAELIDIIGYHGQTLFHKPGQISLQEGDGQLLADKTGITVVNHFRTKDIEAGGQGAPLVPLFHQALAVRDGNIPAAVVNCGGIANISLISGANESDLIGFDTGPGNCLIDRYIRLKTLGKEQMDLNGQYGLQGKVCETTLQILYAKAVLINEKNYFSEPPPKSLDAGNLHLIPELDQLSFADACATLEAFTADSIVQGLKYFKGEPPLTWILGGGGWQNPVIYRELVARLQKFIHPDIVVLTAEEAGWVSSALEGQTFAYLAVRSLRKLPISLPGTTRAPVPLTGGEIHLPASGHTEAVASWLAASTA